MNEKEDGSVNEDTALSRRDGKQGFLGELWHQVHLVYKLFLDPEVPIYLKILPIAAVVYLLFPFDFIPDVIPGFGQLDDITILVIGAKMFIDLAPKQVVARHLQSMQAQEDSFPTADGQPANRFDSSDPDVIEGVIIEDGDVVEQVEDSRE